MTKMMSEVQSAPEHLSMPNMLGFFFEPLYKLIKSRIKKIEKFMPYFYHYKWVFSKSTIFCVFSINSY